MRIVRGGFRWDESNDRDSWNWTTEPSAEITVPVDTTIAKCIALQMTAAGDVAVRVSVNDTALDEVEVRGDVWQQSFYWAVPDSAWARGVMQTVRIEALDGQGPFYVAIQHLRFGPSRVYQRLMEPPPPKVCP